MPLRQLTNLLRCSDILHIFAQERLGTHVASSATVCQIPNPVRYEFASLGPIPTFAALRKRSLTFAIGSYDCLPDPSDPCPGSRPEYAAAAEEMGAELVRRGIGLVLARASAADLVQALEDWRPVRVEKWLDREKWREDVRHPRARQFSDAGRLPSRAQFG